jgi:chaperonin cofactor prefoldin
MYINYKEYKEMENVIEKFAELILDIYSNEYTLEEIKNKLEEFNSYTYHLWV